MLERNIWYLFWKFWISYYFNSISITFGYNPILMSYNWFFRLLHTMTCFIWSHAMWSLNGDHIVGTTVLYNIVTNISLQIIHQINIKCIVCNKNQEQIHLQSICGKHILVFGWDIQTCQISLCKNNSCVLHRLIEHSIVLVI